MTSATERGTVTETPCAVVECSDYPLIQYPIFLCQRHALMVSINVTDILHATALAGFDATEVDADRANTAPDRVWGDPSHQPVVYFIANGDRVKIGTSTNIAARVSTLSFRKSNVLMLLQGGRDLEVALHKRFDADRIGRTEWFVLSRRIHDFITRRQRAEAAMKQSVSPVIPEARLPEALSVKSYRRVSGTNEKIVEVFEKAAAPFGKQVIYLHKDQIAAATGTSSSTLANALTNLVKVGKIHRQIIEGREVRGMYGIGPVPVGEDN